MDKQIDILSKEIANNLFCDYRNLLMSEDTDCGQECLCSIIAIKLSIININDRIKELTAVHEIYGNLNYANKRIKVLEKTLLELQKL